MRKKEINNKSGAVQMLLLDHLRSSGNTRAGFTLIEMLIVIIVLGILAMIVVPQVRMSTDDAKLKTLQINLKSMRSAMEIYHAQHNGTYPGVRTLLGVADASANECANNSFIKQLTQYTDMNGKVSPTKDATHKYGPYIKGDTLPINPFKDSPDVTCERNEDDITVRTSDGSTSWKFYMKTGVLIANDGGSTGGVVHDSF